MLTYEFERLGVAFDSGAGLCTLRATGDKLGIACARFGIALNLQHRALADARATAQLAGQFTAHMRHDVRAATVGYIGDTPNPRTLRREATGAGMGDLARVVSRAYYPSSDESLLQYLDALDWVLDDRRIDEQEHAELIELADSLNIAPEQRAQAHRSYVRRSSPRQDAMASSPKRSGASSNRSPMRLTSPMSPCPKSQGFQRPAAYAKGCTSVSQARRW